MRCSRQDVTKWPLAHDWNKDTNAGETCGQA